MYESLRAGKPVAVPEVESLADSLQGGIGLDNNHSFEMVRELVDELVLVTEEQIAEAMAESVIEERMILEGAGATPIAAVLHHDRSLFGEHIALVASGAMVDTTMLLGIVEKHRDAVSRIQEGPR
jgi:threonine dehydratase